MFEEGTTFLVMSSKCLYAVISTVWAPHWAPKSVTNITIVLVLIKVTLQLVHWSIQTQLISGGDSRCSWIYCLCTGPKGGQGVDLVDCNAVGGGQITTSINQSVNKYQRHSRWKNTNNQLLYSLYCETPKDW